MAGNSTADVDNDNDDYDAVLLSTMAAWPYNSYVYSCRAIGIAIFYQFHFRDNNSDSVKK